MFFYSNWGTQCFTDWDGCLHFGRLFIFVAIAMLCVTTKEEGNGYERSDEFRSTSSSRDQKDIRNEPRKRPLLWQMNSDLD